MAGCQVHRNISPNSGLVLKRLSSWKPISADLTMFKWETWSRHPFCGAFWLAWKGFLFPFGLKNCCLCLIASIYSSICGSIAKLPTKKLYYLWASSYSSPRLPIAMLYASSSWSWWMAAFTDGWALVSQCLISLFGWAGQMDRRKTDSVSNWIYFFD